MTGSELIARLRETLEQKLTHWQAVERGYDMQSIIAPAYVAAYTDALVAIGARAQEEERK